MITILQLKSIMPNAGSRAGVYLPLLNQLMQKYAITGRMRECHFLAQIAHVALCLSNFGAVVSLFYSHTLNTSGN